MSKIYKAFTWFIKYISCHEPISDIYYKYAKKLVKNGKLEESKFWFIWAIEEGSISSHCDLGNVYIQEGNFNVAFLHFKKAKEFPEARYNMGLILSNGYENIIRKDLVEAYKLFRSAANEGYTRAYLSVAIALEKGLGVQQNIIESMKWYRQV